MIRALLLAATLISMPARGQDLVVNGQFAAEDYGPNPQLSSSSGFVANKIAIGPGSGGYVSITFPDGVPNVGAENPAHHLYIKWMAAPNTGETQYQAAPYTGTHTTPNPANTIYTGFRWTFLESNLGAWALSYMGQTVNIDYVAWVDGCCVVMRPILWVSYNATEYHIFDLQDVLVTETPTRFQASYTLPPLDGSKALSQAYLGVGFDFAYRTAPGMHMQSMHLFPAAASSAARPDNLEMFLSRQ